MSRLFLGATTFAPGNGGIGRVARMSAAALAGAVQPVDLRIIALLDEQASAVAGRPVAACRNSKLAFAAQCLGGIGYRHALYDSVGVARAHVAAPFLRRRKAIWIHGSEVWGVPSLRRDYAAAVRSADLVLVNSHDTLAHAEQALGRLPRAQVCWLGTEQDESVPEGDRADLPPSVLILGRMDDREGYKGHDALIDAWPRVAAAVPRARLVIAGGGRGQSWVAQRAAASPAAASIEVLGFVPEREIEAVWRRAHVLAMPSRGEGFGLVYIEAMRHGLPVIASCHDAGREINIDGRTGFNVSLDVEGALAERLIVLLSDAGLRRRMGDAGRRHWHEHFRFSAFAARFLPVMEQFLAS